MLRSSVRPILLLTPFVLVASQAIELPRAGSSDRPPLGARSAVLGGVSAEAETLLQAAQEAAERESMAASVTEALDAQNALVACCDALASLEGAASLPWDTWISDELRHRDLLAQVLYQASRTAEAPEALERAERLSTRSTPVPLRMDAHRSLWELDPFLAAKHGRTLIRERPRGTTSMHARYVDVLWGRPEQMALDLLIDLAHRDGMESYPRMLAIDAIVATGRRDLAADLAGIWVASTGDLSVRKAALLGVLELDLALGKERLQLNDIDESTQPVLYAFVHELRAEYGVTAD